MVKRGSRQQPAISAPSGIVKWEFKWVRKKGGKYLDSKGRESIWDGKDFRCPHYKARSLCKICGGSQICPHGRQKALCKPCGGGSICPHGRQKPKCKDCGGSQICPHGRQKAECKPCNGGSICPHGRQKPNCKDCGGSQICEHGKMKTLCKECRAARTILSLTTPTYDLASTGSCSTLGDSSSDSWKGQVKYESQKTTPVVDVTTDSSLDACINDSAHSSFTCKVSTSSCIADDLVEPVEQPSFPCWKDHSKSLQGTETRPPLRCTFLH